MRRWGWRVNFCCVVPRAISSASGADVILSFFIVAILRGLQRVEQERGHSHRSDAARYRRDPSGALLGSFKFHIADQFSVGPPVDADVDDNGAGLDPVALG